MFHYAPIRWKGKHGLGTDSVNIKATTEEKLGFTGACEGIKAYAVATAFQLPPHPRNTKEMA